MSDITEDQFWQVLNEPEPIIRSYPDGTKSYTWYNEQGERHRENDLPAEIWYDPDGSIYTKRWFKNGVSYRKNGPAQIWYEIK